MNIIIMGVCGSGKSTIGRALADRLGGEFFEGDGFHPGSNIEKMNKGIPLTDRDRADWLTRLSQAIAQRRQAGESTPAVFSCSALKKSYRDQLRRGDPDLRLVHLHGARELLEQRMLARRDHFMPPQLLTSQLATLEEPDEDEAPIIVDVSAGVDHIVDDIDRKLRESRRTFPP